MRVGAKRIQQKNRKLMKTGNDEWISVNFQLLFHVFLSFMSSC